MLVALLLLLCGQVVEAPSVEKDVAAANTLVEQLTAGQFEKVVERFDLSMRVLLPAASVRTAWDATTSAYGKFQRVGESRTETAGKYQIVFVTLAFARGKLDVKVVYEEQLVAGLFFLPHGKYQTPAYVKPDSFREVEISVGKGFFPLPATLSLPNGAGPFPGIVLVHGSGPNDRDETIGPNKPFRDLAQGLASQGIAALRYEKRTRQHPLNILLIGNRLTVKEETIDDAVAAVETLVAQERIDSRRIFVLGHSLGGMVLPRIIAAQDKIAGGICLAGAARPLEDLILEQTKYILSLDGPPTAEQGLEIARTEEQVAKVKSAELSSKMSVGELPLRIPAAYWLDLRDFDPPAAAKSSTVPLLFLQGERDYQVTMEDFARWKETLKKRPHTKFISYPRLNHLFMAGEGKSSPVEYLTPGNVAEQVINDVAAWCKQPRSK